MKDNHEREEFREWLEDSRTGHFTDMLKKPKNQLGFATNAEPRTQTLGRMVAVSAKQKQMHINRWCLVEIAPEQSGALGLAL